MWNPTTGQTAEWLESRKCSQGNWQAILLPILTKYADGGELFKASDAGDTRTEYLEIGQIFSRNATSLRSPDASPQPSPLKRQKHGRTPERATIALRTPRSDSSALSAVSNDTTLDRLQPDLGMSRLTQLMATMNNRITDIQTRQEEQGRKMEAQSEQVTTLAGSLQHNTLATIVNRIQDKADLISHLRLRISTEQNCLDLLTGDGDRVLAGIMRINIGLMQGQLTGLEGELQRLRTNARETANEAKPPLALRDTDLRIDV